MRGSFPNGKKKYFLKFLLSIMKHCPESISATKKKYRMFSLVTSSLLVISSIVYLLLQFEMEGKISDVLFVSLTLFESLFVLNAGAYMMRFVENKGFSFYTSLNFFIDPEEPKVEINKLICSFNHFFKTWHVMLIWAICMGALPYFQNYWEDNLTLSISFGVFLFFTNIITSYFVILLIFFFLRIKKCGR